MKALLLLFASVCFAGAITYEVHVVSQALSLHGTDVSEDFKGEPIQAKVSSFPVVVVGAMPEALVDSVAAPHRIPGPESFKVAESNLLVLCGISLEGELGDKGFICTFDLTKLEIPEEVDLPVRVVLELSIQALKETLSAYYKGVNLNERIFIKITGTNDKNASLKDLATTFKTGK